MKIFTYKIAVISILTLPIFACNNNIEEIPATNHIKINTDTEIVKPPVDVEVQPVFSPRRIKSGDNIFNNYKDYLTTAFYHIPNTHLKYQTAQHTNNKQNISFIIKDGNFITNKVSNNSLYYDNFSIDIEPDKERFQCEKELHRYNNLIYKDVDNSTITDNSSNYRYKSSYNFDKYNHSPNHIQLNQQVNNINITLNNSVINTTAKLVTFDQVYLVDNKFINRVNYEDLKRLADAFTKGKAKINQIFGYDIDTDHNGKIIFVLTTFNKKNILGYFSSNDKLAKEFFVDTADGLKKVINNKSNAGDYLYINITELFHKDDISIDNLYGTLLHEYQHMVSHDFRMIENPEISNSLDIWIDEGLSMLAEYNTGHVLSHKGYITKFFREKQKQSITNFSHNSYGYSLLFFRYLYEVYGDGFIKNLYRSKETGIKAIEDSISLVVNKNIDFNDIYGDFVTMMVTTGKNITTNKKYEISNFNYTTDQIEYSQNGFNLQEILRNLNRQNIDKYNIFSNAGNINIDTYGFQITNWIDIDPIEINFTFDNQFIKGMHN